MQVTIKEYLIYQEAEILNLYNRVGWTNYNLKPLHADGQYGKDDSILSVSGVYHGYRYKLQSFFENLLKTDGFAFSLFFKMAPHFVRNNSVEVNQKKIVQSNDAFPWKGIAVLHPR